MQIGATGILRSLTWALALVPVVWSGVSDGARRWRREKATDPVPALDETAEELLQKRKLTKTEIQQLVDGYLDRMLDTYAKAHGLPDSLVAYLENPKHKVAREVFVSALDPIHDDIGAAARVLESLRAADEKKLTTYIHLGTALAVVFDQPDAVRHSQRYAIWGVDGSQFDAPLGYKYLFDFYTNPRLKSRFRFSLRRLPWCILVHLVDNDSDKEDLGWVMSRYKARTSVDRLYPSVKYDYDKLNTKISKLGSNPYNLPNLLKYGGICGDQAHFSSRVAKSIGIPAMKVSGKGRFGGSGHAWTGYLTIYRGRPILKFTGRYLFDYYYTGDIFDPQTRTRTLDRYIAMMYDGASLSYPKYNQSRLLSRMARKAGKEKPEIALNLLKQALSLNYFNRDAWTLLMDHIQSGTMPQKEGLKWFNTMVKVLKDHPDLTFACLKTFLNCLPADKVDARQSLFHQTFALYKTRPDLQIKLRMAQVEELIAAGRKANGLNLLLPLAVMHAKEGSLILPAVKKAVSLTRELGVQRQALAQLKKADSAFPKMRGSRPSAAYAEFKRQLESLR